MPDAQTNFRTDAELKRQVVSSEGETTVLIDTFPLSSLDIRNLIYTVRGRQVMLDRDLAMLYGVETKVLNQAVSRNDRRFPERFCFRLERNEAESIRSQIVTLYPELAKQDKWWRYMPRVFTEQGVSMLSAVLHSDTAVEVSVQIIDAFVEMRHFTVKNRALFEQVREVELRQLEYQKLTDDRFDKVFDYMSRHTTPKQKIFFSGEIYDAFALLVSLVQQANSEITLIDGYVDASTLNILAKKQPNVSVSVWTHPKSALSQKDIEVFNAQYPHLEVKYSTDFHDRFLILDGINGFLVGASLKDAGKKSFAVSRLEDEAVTQSVLSRLNEKALIAEPELP